MRSLAVTAVSLALAASGAVALHAGEPAPPVQRDATPQGRYDTNWGPARLIHGPGRNQIRLEFDDGSRITAEFGGDGNGRIIGSWMRARHRRTPACQYGHDATLRPARAQCPGPIPRSGHAVVGHDPA